MNQTKNGVPVARENQGKVDYYKYCPRCGHEKRTDIHGPVKPGDLSDTIALEVQCDSCKMIWSILYDMMYAGIQISGVRFDPGESVPDLSKEVL